MIGSMSTADRVDRIQAEWRRERPDVDVGPQGVIGRLHRLAAALTTELVAVYDEFGLGEGDFDVLCALRRAGKPYERQPADLARATMLTTGAITKRLDRLEERGLVRRVKVAGTDRRTKLARLTPTGHALIDKAFTAHMANEQRLITSLPERDRASLERILRGWLQEVDPEDA